VSGLEQHESQVAMQTLESIKNLLSVYEKTIEAEKIKVQEHNKKEITKTLILAVTVIIIAFMLFLTPAKVDIKNVAESKSEAITDDMER